MKTSNTLTDTPRTDAEEIACVPFIERPRADYVSSAFARQLERELAAAKAEIRIAQAMAEQWGKLPTRNSAP
jgi:hypothetical protein